MVELDRDRLLFVALVETFERLGMSVRFEDLSVEDVRGKGGRCRLRDNEMVILDRRLDLSEKIDLLTRELARLPIEGIYLPPNVRRALEKIAESCE